ncbi:MAG: hypothetical protein R6X15_04410 [Pseudomonadota bacterium]
MSEKRYQVIYTGRLKPGQDAATVKSNLVLSLGINEDKANRLLGSERVVLKRCNSSVDAQMLVEKFDQAGIICSIRDTQGGGAYNPAMEAGGESSLVRILRNVSPAAAGDSPSLLRRMIGGGQKRKRA